MERTTPYQRSKALTELECWRAAVAGQDVVVTTSCAVLGSNDYLPSRVGRTLCDFANRKLRGYVDGGFEWVTAQDIAQGHVLCMERGRSGEKYIICSGYHTISEILDFFQDVTGVKRPRLRLPSNLLIPIATVLSYVMSRYFPNRPQRFTPGAIRILQKRRHGNSAKAREELGFEPTSVRSAIAEAYAFHYERGAINNSRRQTPRSSRLKLRTRTHTNPNAREAKRPSQDLRRGSMSTDVLTQNASAPPNLDEATNLRQQVRASGMDPNYWYAVEEVRNVKPGKVVEVVFWKQSIALYRSEDGTFHALDNRCAHRQVKLSLGEVSGCDLICDYHGWRYDDSGRLVHMPDIFARSEPPRVSIRSYPVQVRYGLVWLFPGDPELASERELPEIPEIENSQDGEKPWGTVRVSFTCAAHHSMIIDNVSDFSHAFLHRRYRPFDKADLLSLETRGDNVHMTYESHVGRGKISSRFVDHKRLDTDHIDLCYEYPYQWSNTSDEIKHWLFVLPIDEQTTPHILHLLLQIVQSSLVTNSPAASR